MSVELLQYIASETKTKNTGFFIFIFKTAASISPLPIGAWKNWSGAFEAGLQEV